jgi:hypothetical protein
MSTVKLKVKAKNYRPGAISFAEGFLGPKGNVGYVMVADWKKAKYIINKLIRQGRNIEDVEMGLDGDWNCNSMVVYENGKFTKYTEYSHSTWAEPIMIVNYKDAPSEAYSVWRKIDQLTTPL